MRYFTFTSLLNAYTLKIGLKKLGINLETMGNGTAFIAKSKNEPNEGDVLFFTEEANLKKYLQQKYYFYPKNIREDLIDDKYAFAEFLSSNGEAPVPQSHIGELPNKYPVYLKARHSWVNGKKVARGFICYSDEERNKYFEEIKAKGWNTEWFFYQKLLTSPLSHNISVTGYFDVNNEKRNLFLVTSKFVGDAGKISTGWMVATINDPERLVERAKNILKLLNYAGPFELEYFYEEADKKYYVLELNPRFWMQHGLFLTFFDNGLIKRYLELDSEKDWVNERNINNRLLWVNTVGLVYSMVRFRFGFCISLIKMAMEEWKVCFYPCFCIAILYLIRESFIVMIRAFLRLLKILPKDENLVSAG